MKKRILSLCLALVILFGLLPVTASANGVFRDVSDGDWFAEAVEYVADRGLMEGIGGSRFSPNETVTRAMVVTILHRMAMQPYAKVSSFDDVPVSAWYANAVAWAAEHGIAEGVGNGLFAPDAAISRQQLAAILYRYADFAGEDVSARANLQNFADADEIADYALRAMEWAVGCGLLDGMDEDTLAPNGTATRAQLAAVLMRFEGAEGPYDDVYTPVGTHPGHGKPDYDPDDEPTEDPDDPVTPPTEDPDDPVTPPAEDPDDPVTPPAEDPDDPVTPPVENPDEPVTPPVEDPTEGKDAYNAAIWGITADGDALTVQLSTEEDCTLLVQVLDEQTEELLCAVQAAVEKEETAVTVSSQQELSRYFIVTAQLFAADGTPLNNRFTCLDYTRGYAEFLEKTPADFPAERVLPVSDNGEGGFLVLDEDVARLDVIPTAEDDGTYRFPAGTDLSAGQKICFVAENGAYKVIRVLKAVEEGGAVIVTADSAVGISDLYDFIKVDASFKNKAQEPVMRAAHNLRANKEDDTGIFTAIEFGPAITGSITAPFGSLDASLQAGGDVKAQYDPKIWGDDYLRVDVMTKIKVEGDVVVGPTSDIKVEQELIPEIPLAGLEALGQIALNVKGIIGVESQVGAGMHLSAEVGVGHTYNTKDGGQKYDYRNITPSDFHVDNNIEASVELEAGIRASLDASVLSDLVTFSIGAGAGLGAEGEILVPLPPVVGSTENEHACDLCMDGRTYGYVNANLNLDYEINDHLRGDIFDLELARAEWTINKMYASLINEAESVHKGQATYGWGECPNRKYLTVVTCYDTKNVQKENCAVEIVKTVGNHEVAVDSGASTFRTRLYPGSYIAKATIDTNEEVKSFTVTDGVEVVKIYGTDCIVSGTVMGKEHEDEAAKPLSGASVVVLNEEGTATVTSTTTAQDGTYSLTLPGGSYKLSFRADGFDPAVYTLSNLQEDKSINPVLESADKQGMLTGSVSNKKTGEPISGASVQILQGGEIVTAATTDENGQYSVELKEGDYTVSASAEKYRSATVGTAVKAKKTTALHISLEPEEIGLTVTVLHEDGSVAAGATVRIPALALSEVTDDTGVAEFQMEEGSYTVTAEIDGYSDTKTVPVAAQTAVTLILQKNYMTWSYDRQTQTLTVEGRGPMACYSYGGGAPWYQYRRECRTVHVIGLSTVGDFAFSGFLALRDVVLSDNTTMIGKAAFQNCQYLDNVVIPRGVTMIGYSGFVNCTGLKNISIPDTVTMLDTYAFAGCSSLAQITIPECVTSIGYGAFSDCTSLETVTLPASLTTMGEHVFDSCTALTAATFSEGASLIGRYAFNKCSALTQVVVPDSVKKIGEAAFSQCTSLISVHIPEGVPEIEDMVFYRCENLRDVVLPDSVTSIGLNAFYQCYALEHITLPESVTTIEAVAFYQSGLKEIVIPSQVEYIRNSTFYQCASLEKVTFPENLKTIEKNAFHTCERLNHVVIPERVTSIGSQAFYNCTALTDITLPEQIRYIEEDAFYGCPFQN